MVRRWCCTHLTKGAYECVALFAGTTIQPIIASAFHVANFLLDIGRERPQQDPMVTSRTGL
jgi:hypothetical protein